MDIVPKLNCFRSNMSISVTYVSPPRPMVVKKLMENLVFLGLSLGKSPSKYGWRVL